jgi:pimeloyl-ACP methyl ester carboxylesterase
MLHRPQQPRNIIDAAPAPLLMLPGTLCDARLYAPVLDRLGTRAAVPQLAGAESAVEMARCILATAPPRISLCGFSLGAIVALEIVAQAPHRVERLALLGCNPGRLDDKARAARAALIQSDFATEDDCPLVHLMARDASAETYRQQTRMTLDRADSRPRLSQIKVPTLILCGAHDRICPPAMSIAMAGAIPQARLVIVPGAGHYLPLERPDVVANELAAWLAMPVPHTVKEPS